MQWVLEIFTNTIFHSHCQSLSSSNTNKGLWNFKVRKDSLTVALFSWIATSTQVPVSDNEKLPSSFFIFLYVGFFFFHCLHYTSWAISASVNKMSQHTLPLKTNGMACFTRIKVPAWNVITSSVSWWLKTIPGSRCPLSHAQLLFGESYQPQTKTHLRAG